VNSGEGVEIMRDRKSSSSHQRVDVNRGLQRQQSQDIKRDDRKRSGAGSGRKQQQMNRTHRGQQR
jgi:hypothetical protein